MRALPLAAPVQVLVEFAPVLVRTRPNVRHDRFEYEEVRMVALAPETATLFYVAFVERGSVRRIISLRRATRREVKHYVESI